MEEKEVSGREDVKNPLSIFFRDIRSIFKLDELGQEIGRIALPAALALTADPIASLVDTAFIGHIETKSMTRFWDDASVAVQSRSFGGA
ncbi:protein DETOXIFICATION 42-like [Solanum lycopersicum]|uniref:protein DETOXIFICATION 42-like n=1 Tax=Solanum lycopersicum TaxID=4081 RepID=UPI003748C534